MSGVTDLTVELGPISPVTSPTLSVWCTISSANENVDVIVTDNTNSTRSTVQAAT